MKTSTAIITVAILVVGGMVIFSGNGDNNQGKIEKVESSSTLSSDKESFDFGEIDIYGGTVETEFPLTNEGADGIIITSGTTSCGCTDGEIGGISFGMHEKMSDEFTIPAGETRNLKVIYDPMAHGPSGVGLAQRSVFLKTNSTVTPEFEVRIKATVIKTN
jgi:hypothetical protein